MSIYCADCDETYEWEATWTFRQESLFMLNQCPMCGSCRCEQ